MSFLLFVVLTLFVSYDFVFFSKCDIDIFIYSSAHVIYNSYYIKLYHIYLFFLAGMFLLHFLFYEQIENYFKQKKIRDKTKQNVSMNIKVFFKKKRKKKD